MKALVVLSLVLCLAAGGLAGYVVAGEQEPEEVTTAQVGTETSTTTTTRTKTTTVAEEPDEIFPEPTVLGQGVIDDLFARNAISHSERVVPPKPGWKTEFEVDTAKGVLRFKNDGGDRVISYSWLRGPEGRMFADAVDEVAAARGYTESDP